MFARYKRPIIILYCLCHSLINLYAQEHGNTIGVIANAHNITVTKEGGRNRVYADYQGVDGKPTFFYYSTPIVGMEIENDHFLPENIDTLYYLPSANLLSVVNTKKALEVKIETDKEVKSLYFSNEVADQQKRNTRKYKDNSNDFLEKGHNLFVFPSRYENSYWSIGIDGLTIGFCSANGQTQPKKFQWIRSYEIGWLNILSLKYTLRNSVFSFGVGIDWKSFCNAKSADYLSYSNSGGLIWKEYEDDRKGKGSSLRILSIQFPLLWQYTFPQTSFSVKVGPIFNLNTYSSIKTVYIDKDGDKYIRLSGASRLNLFTTDCFVNLSFHNTFGVYFRYSPWNIIKNANGLNFHPLSIGLSIGI